MRKESAVDMQIVGKIHYYYLHRLEHMYLRHMWGYTES